MEFSAALRRLFSGRRPAVRLLERLQPPSGACEAMHADRLSPSLLLSSALQFTLSTPSVSPTASSACDYPVQHLSARWGYGRRVGTIARVASFAPPPLRAQTQRELLVGIQGG